MYNRSFYFQDSVSHGYIHKHRGKDIFAYRLSRVDLSITWNYANNRRQEDWSLWWEIAASFFPDPITTRHFYFLPLLSCLPSDKSKRNCSLPNANSRSTSIRRCIYSRDRYNNRDLFSPIKIRKEESLITRARVIGIAIKLHTYRDFSRVSAISIIERLLILASEYRSIFCLRFCQTTG